MFVLKPLARRSIALLWTGQVLAATGSELYMVAVVWIAAGLVGRDAGYVSALQAAALLAGSLFGGLVTDRWRPRTTMIAADLARAGLVAVLSAAGLLGGLGLPLLMAVAAAVALGTAAFDPALQATLPALAGEPALRHAANGLFDATKRMARILGPSLVALVNGFLPTGQFFLATTLTFALSALAVRAAVGDAPPPARPRGAVLDSLLGGLRVVRGHPLVIYGLVANLIGNVSWSLGVLLGMVLLLRQTSADPLTDYSLMMTAYGVGNLGANLVLASLGPGRPARWLVASKLTFGLGVVFLPLAPSESWRMAIAGLAAINGPLENLALLQLLQARFPGHRLGQVYRLQMCAVFAGVLLGYLSAPTLYALVGLAPAIMGAGAVTVVAGLVGAGLFRGRRAG